MRWKASFTKKERWGILAIGLVIFVGLLVRFFLGMLKDERLQITIKELSAEEMAASHQGVVVSHEINSMTRFDFQQIAYFSSIETERILSYRLALGGFYSLLQLKEIIPISDSMMIWINKRLRCDASLVKRIELDSNHLDRMREHPYIGESLSLLLLHIKENKKGQNLDAYLEQIMSKDKIIKIKNYLIFD